LSSEQPSAHYTYLTLPPVANLRSCIGLILAGMAARAEVGVGGLEEAVERLEDEHSGSHPTGYRFSVGEESVIVEVKEQESAASEVGAAGVGGDGWRRVVEMST
jgi:putative transcriptional regulator